jgi:tetratricopeptide (TPR) repeat protein
MFMARHKRRSGRDKRAEPPAGRKAARLSTLERRYGFHRDEAVRAALEGSHDKATKHSGTALRISRELYAAARDPVTRQPELAAALCAHAPYNGKWQAIAMLTESAGLYAALAAADPAVYEVPRIDVLTRVALASDAAGATRDAIDLLREVTGMYLKAPAADTEERDLGLARARFHLGRCLLKTGMAADGLAEIDAGLELAADALDRLGLTVIADGWLAVAPRYLQLAAPEWAVAAVRSMTLHADAGRWQQAATSARAALLISGGLAGLGGELPRDAHRAIGARVRTLEGIIPSQLQTFMVDEALAGTLDLGLGRGAVGPV